MESSELDFYRRLDLGRERLPNDREELDFEEWDGERGLTFRTLPLIERRRLVTDPPSLDGLVWPVVSLRGDFPASELRGRLRFPPREDFFFRSRLLNARNSSSSASAL